MILVRGRAGGTELTGTIYERGEDAPSFRGAPDEDAAYVWVCDEFYEVDSGGSSLTVDDREINVAFESPMPRGFDTKDQALEAAKEHVRTQFARIGIEPDDVEIVVEKEREGTSPVC
ncbi:DUF7113 family protein [Natrialbaceae archaeon AArc-T1-2]|uniref:DUF7113 family protein n=1 Tax=Natrialbaceae archaeon AArc-T1-2 TaxID=3053904 RepID=UPI00255AA048|nr:hypothetical protein [Natrialbaceae archaeon AArc-T1-2]WIV66801.1 hypothetical protein QQ977_14065 [Natrialbaceae archaeon AArc-T1-2]